MRVYSLGSIVPDAIGDHEASRKPGIDRRRDLRVVQTARQRRTIHDRALHPGGAARRIHSHHFHQRSSALKILVFAVPRLRPVSTSGIWRMMNADEIDRIWTRGVVETAWVAAQYTSRK
jgi:hypothetical protein